MLTGISYKDAKKIIADRNILDLSKLTLYTTTNELVEIITSFGIELLEEREFHSWEFIKTISIVAINYRKSTGNWHWVLFIPNEDSNYVLVPNQKIKTEKQTDFLCMKLESYILLSLPS